MTRKKIKLKKGTYRKIITKAATVASGVAIALGVASELANRKKK